MERRLWTREELILALNLYLKLPFGKLHHGTPEIIHLAKILDRTPNSIAMRLSNFASVDPYHQERGIKGLTGASNKLNLFGTNSLIIKKICFLKVNEFWPILRTKLLNPNLLKFYRGQKI